LPALNVSMAAQIRWFPDMTESVENDRWNEFEKTAVYTTPADIDVNGDTWNTYSSLPLSNDDVAYIRKGKEKLYVFIHWKYQDSGGGHDTEYCHALQTPISVIGPGQIQDVWNTCHGHRKIR